jgi:hypothetical protein
MGVRTDLPVTPKKETVMGRIIYWVHTSVDDRVVD